MIQGIISSRSAVIKDPYWDNVVGLWHFEGDGITAYDAKYGRILNGANGATQDSFPLIQQKSAGYFQGNSNSNSAGQYFASQDILADWTIGSGDYTIEATIYLDAAKAAMSNRYMVIVGNAITGNQCWYLYLGQDYDMLAFFYNQGSYDARGAPFNFQFGVVYRVALSIKRLNSTTVQFSFFVNGVLIGQYLDDNLSSFSGTNTNLTVGRINVPSYYYYFKGYIDEVRLTKGVARYDGDYLIDTRPFPDR